MWHGRHRVRPLAKHPGTISASGEDVQILYSAQAQNTTADDRGVQYVQRSAKIGAIVRTF